MKIKVTIFAMAAMVLATKCSYDKTYAIPTNGTAYGLW